MKTFVILAGVLLAGGLHAAEETYASAGQAVPWLALPRDAAAAGRAGAGLAARDGGGLNPAGLAAADGQRVGFMHQSYMEQISVEHLRWSNQLGARQGLGLDLDYISFGSVDRYRVVNNRIQADGSLNPMGYALGLGYGRGLGRAWSLGATLKAVSRNLDGFTRMGYGADLGLGWQGSRVGLGLTLQDAGAAPEGGALPAKLGLGLAYTQPLGAVALGLQADVVAPVEASGATALRLGAELGSAGGYALRAGYGLQGQGGLGGLSAGAGARLGLLSLDYALNQLGDLGLSHLLSLSARF